MIVFKVVVKDKRVERECLKLKPREVAEDFFLNSAMWVGLRNTKVSVRFVKQKKKTPERSPVERRRRIE